MFADTYYGSGHHCTKCGKHFCRCENPPARDDEPEWCQCDGCRARRRKQADAGLHRKESR